MICGMFSGMFFYGFEKPHFFIYDFFYVFLRFFNDLWYVF